MQEVLVKLSPDHMDNALNGGSKCNHCKRYSCDAGIRMGHNRKRHVKKGFLCPGYVNKQERKK